MTLGEAIAEVSEDAKHGRASLPDAYKNALDLLTEYFPKNSALDHITPLCVRDFLSRWYAEKASYAQLHGSGTTEGKRTGGAIPEPEALIESLGFFFNWADRRSATQLIADCKPVLDELMRSLPQALKITTVLSRALSKRGGAFGFSEFLTSFEEGGHSRYDIDSPDEVGSLEGYFRVLEVEGSSIEAEEIITEQRIRPIFFPREVMDHLEEGFIINLELVRTPSGWQIADCGFAYPPGTQL